MACLFGGRVARSGHVSVILAGSWSEAISAIHERGVLVEEGGHTWSAPVRAAPLEATPRADVVLVLVKSAQTLRVAPLAAASVADGGVVLTLQNGLGNVEALGTAIDPARIVVGVTTAGATLLAPGHVRAYPAPCVLGRDRAGRAQSIADLLTAAGFPTAVEDDIDGPVWRKLAVNCAINPLSALRGVPNGALLDNPDDRALLQAAAAEVEAVAVARGTRLVGDYREAVLEAARVTAGNRSSMLQDIERGVPTEIEAMNGAVVREGNRLGVPTPTLSSLLEQVRTREAVYRDAAATA